MPIGIITLTCVQMLPDQFRRVILEQITLLETPCHFISSASITIMARNKLKEFLPQSINALSHPGFPVTSFYESTENSSRTIRIKGRRKINCLFLRKKEPLWD